MLLPSRVAGRTLGLRGPDLARGPEVARLWSSYMAHLKLPFRVGGARCFCEYPSFRAKGGLPCRQTTTNHYRNAVNMQNLGQCVFMCR